VSVCLSIQNGRDIVHKRFDASEVYNQQYDAADVQVYRITKVDLSEASFDTDDECPPCDQPMP